MADATARLWPDPAEVFYRDRTLIPQLQRGPTCVATSLAIITGAEPAAFIGHMNTQDPSSWSATLAPFGMKLAYTPTDIRKLRHYADELIGYDDLFTIGFYTPGDATELLEDPDPDTGWLCGSHMVVLHRDRILDPARGKSQRFRDYDRLDCHTKRIFRVVPVGHRRGL